MRAERGGAPPAPPIPGLVSPRGHRPAAGPSPGPGSPRALWALPAPPSSACVAPLAPPPALPQGPGDASSRPASILPLERRFGFSSAALAGSRPAQPTGGTGFGSVGPREPPLFCAKRDGLGLGFHGEKGLFSGFLRGERVCSLFFFNEENSLFFLEKKYTGIFFSGHKRGEAPGLG